MTPRHISRGRPGAKKGKACLLGSTFPSKPVEYIFCCSLGRFEAGAARRVVMLPGFHSDQPMHLDREQPPKSGAAPPDVRGVGLPINGQRNAVKRLRRTSNSHLPPRLLPFPSLADRVPSLNRSFLNKLTFGVNP